MSPKNITTLKNTINKFKKYPLRKHHKNCNCSIYYTSLLKTTLLYLGKLFGLPHFSMQNFRGPVDPRRAANPSYGMLDVPVTNCSNLNRCSLVNRLILLQNHSTTG